MHEAEGGYPLLSASERWELLMAGFYDHVQGEHDWSCADPYDCVVCHVLVELYGDAREHEGYQRRNSLDAIFVEALVAAADKVEHERQCHLRWPPTMNGRQCTCVRRELDAALEAFPPSR